MDVISNDLFIKSLFNYLIDFSIHYIIWETLGSRSLFCNYYSSIQGFINDFTMLFSRLFIITSNGYNIPVVPPGINLTWISLFFNVLIISSFS